MPAENVPPRRVRHTPAENRAALIAAGIAELDRRGLSTPLGMVTLRAAIDASGVPRQSAYNIYSTGRDQDPQVLFHRDVIDSILEGPLTDPHVTAAPVLELLENSEEVLRTGTPVELGVLFRELIRVSCERWYRAATESLGFRVLLSTLIADSNSSDRQAESTSAKRIRELHHQMESDLNTLFGIRYRPGITPQAVAAIWSAQLAGLLILESTSSLSDGIARDTGEQGEQQLWTPLAVAVEAMTIRFMETDPDATRSMSFEPLNSAEWLSTKDH